VQIRRLKIERYRGIEKLVWCPGPSLNCLIGPGDVGKSTILDAIAMVLSSAPGRVASEHDYHGGDVAAGFKIEVLVGRLDEEVLSAWPAAPVWTWMAAEERAQADPDARGEGVLCLRAQGTGDLEVEHVAIDPSGGELPLSPSKRQAFGLSRIGSAGAAYRELRMSRGSLLSRNIQPEQLRALVTEAVQATRDQFSLSEETEARVQGLSQALKAIAPGAGELDLAMLSPPGQNLLGMVGLFASSGETSVPLASAGLGTQQLALFTLARLLISGSPLFVIDEIESGLEPFRQRDLIARIRKTIGSEGQAFITTHSPAAVGEMVIEELHRVDPPGDGLSQVAALPSGLEKIRRSDPEALLCRIPIILEGQTEIGLLQPLLEERGMEADTTLGALGVRLVDGGGQPKVFGVTDALVTAGQRFGAFLDDEVEHKGRRASLATAENVAFGTYTEARCLEEALSKQLSIEDLDRLITASDSNGRDHSASRYQQLNDGLGNQSRKTLVQLATELSEDRCRAAFSEVATRRGWFKAPQTSIAVGEYLRDHHADIQIVRDAGELWASVMDLISTEVPSEGPGDGGRGA
jgi:putative ATP-dependent endonuclease of the OLD family